MQITGRIVKAISGFYYVSAEDSVYECRARGTMRKTGTPFVGDLVDITVDNGGAVVEKVHSRKNEFHRPPISNVDKLYIVSSFKNPSPNTLIIDKLICMCEDKDIEPVLVFNKCDMGDFSHYSDLYTKAGFNVYVVSCEDGSGIEQLKNSLEGVCVFTGNSGVGKSSILNRFFPQLSLQTGEISDKLGRGRHTTRHVELYKCESGFVADTPGFSTVESNIEDKDKVCALFREFSDYLGQCKFTSCSHTKEKGCAIIEAVERGKISRERFDSYCNLYIEASKNKPWEK